ncbi:MAG: FAD-dependent oxidoreductase [Actinomycetota bacterium]|nr:FAD-dependent oxidoreductase [Actinomycetota bacterium]
MTISSLENQSEGSGRRPRVIVVGAGFGGFFAARRLQRADIELTVLSPTDGMLYQPLLPDVAVGALDPRSVLVPLTATLRKARLVRGHATALDPTARTLAYHDLDGVAGQLPYDRLLLAPGAVTKLLDIPGLAEHAIGLKTVTEALYLRDHLLGRLETASVLTDPVRRRAALTFIVVGAGYAGVELTAQMARLTANLLPLHPGIAAGDVRWLLIDVAKQVMPALGASLGESALHLLKRRDVDVRLGVSLTTVTDAQVTLSDGDVLDCSTVIWCAGVTPNPLIAAVGLPTTKGRLSVDEFLRVPSHPEIYALGDCAAVPDLTKPVDEHGQQPLCPPTAQHAMRQAHAAARNILADLHQHRYAAKPYRHHDLGLVVDLGGPDAAATPLGVHLRGRAAKLVTRGYHLYALPTGKRRVRVALDWALAGRRPDDVSLGLPAGPSALITHAEDDQG